MSTVIQLLLLCSLLLTQASAAEVHTITGRVVDADGAPVGDAAIDFFWCANGPLVDDEGKRLDPTSEEGEKRYWSRYGEMEPVLKTTSQADGRFSLEARGSFHTIMAMDADRARGGLAMIPKNHDGSEVEIRLQPLIRIEATIKGAEPGRQPAEVHAVVEVPADPARPLDLCRLVVAQARDSRLLLSLPPGRYLLDAYDGEFKTEVVHEFVIKGETPEVDLGKLTLSPTLPNINERIEQSRASGTLGDYTKHYGEKLPAWNIVDARGVDKKVQLADFQGKWVLVNFWALNCASCLKHDLPRLAQFYHDHKAQREQFEIQAICVDCNGEKQSIAAVDRSLEPIVKHVWDGKRLPFPILLDPSMTTLERFGVPGYQTILIDPEGRLVEGDETTLAKKLDDQVEK